MDGCQEDVFHERSLQCFEFIAAIHECIYVHVLCVNFTYEEQMKILASGRSNNRLETTSLQTLNIYRNVRREHQENP